MRVPQVVIKLLLIILLLVLLNGFADGQMGALLSNLLLCIVLFKKFFAQFAHRDLLRDRELLELVQKLYLLCILKDL